MQKLLFHIYRVQRLRLMSLGVIIQATTSTSNCKIVLFKSLIHHILTSVINRMELEDRSFKRGLAFINSWRKMNSINGNASWEKLDTEGQLITNLNATIISIAKSVPIRQINWNATKTMSF